MTHRAAYLIIACCALMHMNTVILDAKSISILSTNVVQWFIAVIITSVLTMVLAAIVYSTPLAHYRVVYYTLGGITLALGMVALGMFEATAIQFGMDQLLESPSCQLSNFIHWYYWSCNVGQLLITYMEMSSNSYVHN